MSGMGDGWPRAAVPLHPVASWRCLGGLGAAVPAVDEAGARIDLISARVALAHALQLLGVGPADRVLLPGFHCTAMVEPCDWLGATPVFYRVTPGLDIDFDDLARRAEGARVLVAVHYFGFPQDLERLETFCRDRGILLIEDCAHSFFGRHQGRALGATGEFAIASWWKFFPVREGGCLVSAKRDRIEVDLEAVGRSFELRSFVRSFDGAGEYGRLQPLSGAMRLAQAAASVVRRRPETAEGRQAAGFSLGSPKFDTHWLGKRWSRTSRYIARHADRRRIVERRRANYRQLAGSLAGEAGLRLLHPDLPGDVVPYVLPVLVDEAPKVFAILKGRGVPVLRFGEILWPAMDRSFCPVTDDYSDRLFQFPCHQELSPRELRWLADQILEAVQIARP